MLKTNKILFGLLLVQAFFNSASAQVVFSETFNLIGATQYNVMTAGAFTTQLNSSSQQTYVDLITPDGQFNTLCPNSHGCVDMNGTFSYPPVGASPDARTQGILQKSGIVLAAGNYYFNFKLYGSNVTGASTLTDVYLGDGTNTYYYHQFNLTDNDTATGMVSAQFTIPSGGATVYIRFESLTAGQDGAKLDAVSITANNPPAADWELADLPTVTSVGPSNGPIAGGTSITVTGTNFTTDSSVTVGGTACTNVVFVSATSLTCTTPAGTAGTASVLVTTTGGTSTANSLFTYVAPAVAPVPTLSTAAMVLLTLLIALGASGFGLSRRTCSARKNID